MATQKLDSGSGLEKWTWPAAIGRPAVVGSQWQLQLPLAAAAAAAAGFGGWIKRIKN